MDLRIKINNEDQTASAMWFRPAIAGYGEDCDGYTVRRSTDEDDNPVEGFTLDHTSEGDPLDYATFELAVRAMFALAHDDSLETLFDQPDED